MILAINQAVADGASVISMSLGSDFASVPLADDPDVIASDNAAGAGVVVVASSGNAGPGAYITGVPAAGNRTISVAALDAQGATSPGAHIVVGTATVDGALNDNIGLGGGITARSSSSATGPAASAWAVTLSDYDGTLRRHRGDPARDVCARVMRANLGRRPERPR